MLNEKFLKPYDPKETEDRIYKMWEESGHFQPEGDGDPFSIVLPPPNVTGQLHTGHAVMLAVEDIMVRYHRMLGNKTLWIPGTDHAAIATQSKVEKELQKKEKKNRHDLGREEFLKRVNKFAEESHDTIVGQTKRMGASLDWSREAFTLDELREKAVNEAFERMHNAGLIYRGHRIVNWCPKMQTTVSDDEVEYVEEKTPLYYLKYGPFTIATARPETKFGDKYVVMHPDDKRYSNYKHRQKIDLEWINGPTTATIIKDEVIDMEFGSGVMTITPWHDMTDFELSERHNLEKEQIINELGKLMPIAGEFAGMKIKDVRKLIIEKLKQKGLIEKVEENYTHNIATNSRGGGIIEPQIQKQWFVDVNKKFKLQDSKLKGLKTGQEVSLKEVMKNAVESGQIEIMPKRFEKVYYHWIDNLRDWCISRQIWYGHRIPVWYSVNSNLKSQISKPQPKNQNLEREETFVGTIPPDDGWERDPDTLDTWFSSGLWTFSTLGWPFSAKATKDRPSDLETFHPTSVLETGYDILFFWVARMILMSGFLLEDVPFKKVYLHGLVRDEKGRKMSKSLDNSVDPLELIDKYGADALRMAMIVGVGPGNDQNLFDNKVKAYKHFANKIWNASRFVFENVNHTQSLASLSEAKLLEQDSKYISEFENLKKEITREMNEYKFYLASEKLYHYFWHTFADIIIEDCKKRIGDPSAQYTLLTILKKSLILLHPFMPFITEEVWQNAPWNKKSEMLITEKWTKS